MCLEFDFVLLNKKFILISLNALSESIKKNGGTKKERVREKYKAIFDYHIKH